MGRKEKRNYTDEEKKTRITSIKVTMATRDRLRGYGMKEESFTALISRIMDSIEKGMEIV